MSLSMATLTEKKNIENVSKNPEKKQDKTSPISEKGNILSINIL